MKKQIASNSALSGELICAFRSTCKPLAENIEPVGEFMSEFAKSRLLNKDSRFRKDCQYVFFLLWQKEMRELAAGVYNIMKGTRKHALPVSGSFWTEYPRLMKM